MTKPTPDTLLTDPRLPQLTQHPDQYTDEDLQVWELLFERQYQFLPQAASKVYLEGLEAIGFSADQNYGL